MVECKICGRQYEFDKKKGHTKSVCNSCTVNKQRFTRKKRCIEYKGGKCERCGYNKCDRALTFHHTDPSKKEFQIGGNHARSWEATKSELDKCMILCFNCHMEVHDEEVEERKTREASAPIQFTVKKIEHGTSTSYSYHGCRCAICTEHQKLKIRKEVAARKAKKITDL